jgi:hypothetical protein
MLGFIPPLMVSSRGTIKFSDTEESVLTERLREIIPSFFVQRFICKKDLEYSLPKGQTPDRGETDAMGEQSDATKTTVVLSTKQKTIYTTVWKKRKS